MPVFSRNILVKFGLKKDRIFEKKTPTFRSMFLKLGIKNRVRLLGTFYQNLQYLNGCFTDFCTGSKNGNRTRIK